MSREERKMRQAYRQGIRNTIELLLVSGFFTAFACEIVTKLF